jgi:hypothetical protein
MTSREDLLKRAAECERLMDGEADNVPKIVFGLISDIWGALAHESASMSPEELAQEVAVIAQIQFGFREMMSRHDFSQSRHSAVASKIRSSRRH